jgi:hypothetical protein
VDADVERIVVVWLGVQREACTAPGGDNRLADTVLDEVVVEVRTRRQTEHEVRDLGLRINGDVPHLAQAVIPMIAADILLERERIARKRGIHSAYTLRSIHAEGFAIAAATNLEFVAAPDEVVVDGINGEQNPNTTVGFGVQHQQVAV